MARRNGGESLALAEEIPGVALSAPQVTEIMREIRTAMIEAPLGEMGNGYLQRHVEARLDRTQAESMKRLTAGLRDTREQTRNGREVTTAADSVKWLLEKLTNCG